MKKIKIILILLVLVILGLKTDVLAETVSYECSYKDSSGNKIKLSLSTDTYAASKIYVNPGSNLTSFSFKPANAVFLDGNNVQGGRFWYKKNINDDGNAAIACPASIDIYYLKDKKEYLINNKSEYKIYTYTPGSKFSTFYNLQDDYLDYTSTIISFSSKGYELSTNNELNSYVDVFESKNILSNYVKDTNIFSNIHYTYDKENTNIDEPNEEGYLVCSYRSRTDRQATFYLRKNYNSSSLEEYVTINNQKYGNLVRENANAIGNLVNCPTHIAYPSGSDQRFYMILSNCSDNSYDSDDYCFFRNDIPIDYEGGVSKKIKYVNLQNKTDIIEIEVLKAPNSSGQTVIFKKNGQEQNVTINESTFIGGETTTYPVYVTESVNNGQSSYNFTSSVDNNSNTYSGVYMLSSQINKLNNIGQSEIEKTCEAIFGGGEGSFMGFLKNNVFKVIWIAVPIILLILTTIDFAKVVFNDEKEGLNNAWKRFGKRAIAAVLIFLTPTILIFIADVIGADDVNSCIKAIQNMNEGS